MVIKRIGVGSAAKIGGVLEAAIGLVAGIVFAGFGTIAGVAGAGADPDFPRWLLPMFGIGGLILMPIFYGVIGVITGAVGALLYNAAAGIIGGLEIDVS